MLTISKAIKAGQGEYYLSLAGVDDYYTAGTEPPVIGSDAEQRHSGWRMSWTRISFATCCAECLLMVIASSCATRTTNDAPVGISPGRHPSRCRSGGVRLTPPRASALKSVFAVPPPKASPTSKQWLASAGVARMVASTKPHDWCWPRSSPFDPGRAQDPQLHLHTILLNVGARPRRQRPGTRTQGTLSPSDGRGHVVPRRTRGPARNRIGTARPPREPSL